MAERAERRPACPDRAEALNKALVVLGAAVAVLVALVAGQIAVRRTRGERPVPDSGRDGAARGAERRALLDEAHAKAKRQQRQLKERTRREAEEKRREELRPVLEALESAEHEAEVARRYDALRYTRARVLAECSSPWQVSSLKLDNLYTVPCPESPGKIENGDWTCAISRATPYERVEGRYKAVLVASRGTGTTDVHDPFAGTITTYAMMKTKTVTVRFSVSAKKPMVVLKFGKDLSSVEVVERH